MTEMGIDMDSISRLRRYIDYLRGKLARASEANRRLAWDYHCLRVAKINFARADGEELEEELERARGEIAEQAAMLVEAAMSVSIQGQELERANELKAHAEREWVVSQDRAARWEAAYNHDLAVERARVDRYMDERDAALERERVLTDRICELEAAIEQHH